MRKVLVILLVILAVGVAAVSVYFVFSKKEEPVSGTLYDAIPLDAGLIVDIRDYGELSSLMRESRLWEQLSQIPSAGVLSREILFLDSLAQKYEQGAPFRHRVIFSLHPIGKDEMYSIGFVRMNSEREARALTDQLETRLAGNAAVARRSYDHTNITDITFDGKDRQAYNFSCAYRSGIFMFSRSSLLLESALRQIAADHNIMHQGQLAELIRTAGKNVPANIYISYSQLPRTASSVLQTGYRNTLEPLVRYADWTELDLNLKSDLLLLNGFTTCRPGEEQLLSAFRSQQSIPVTLVDAMPSTTHAFFWMGINRLQQYFSDYGRHLDRYKESGYKKELNRIKNTFLIDLQVDFAGLFENEAALVHANVGQTTSKEAAYALFRVKSASAAISMLEEWHAAIKKGSGDSPDREKLPFDHQLEFTAYKLPFDLPASLFGDIFSGENSWCVVADNYLVFGSSPANLKKYLHYTALHASLQTNPGYGKLANYFSTRSNVMFYCNPALSGNLPEGMPKAGKYRKTEETGEVLPQMQAVVYQLNNTGGMLYNNLFVKYSPEGESVSTGTQTSWESLLDTAISFKPQLVQNHSTGETEVFVQDMANNIYLLNNAGRILWKAALPEPILSPVYQIDMYRNGKLQMLFNTRNYLYVVDRLGNFVEKYPVRLKSPAVGAVALFDYDGNRQYRMMVACEDRRVYAYEKTGKPVSGWNFGQSEHPVQTGIYHYRIENKDFIVFADKYRVYILDRQGRRRVSPERNLPVALRTTIALDRPRSLKQARLSLTDTTGTVHFISLADGRITQQKIKDFPSSHFFVFQDVDSDGQSDFIFAADHKLEVFGQDGKQIFEISTETPIDMCPCVYEFGADDLRIGIVQPQNNHIWLYSNRGKVHKGFPLEGSTLFSIGRLDRKSSNFNLFVGSSNNFLYNYSVR